MQETISHNYVRGFLLLVSNLMHEVGFEPTSLSTVELKSTPLDHSGIRAKIYT